METKILSVFAIASLMFATSCSEEEFESVQNEKESTVVLTAQIPEGLQTKQTIVGNGDVTPAATAEAFGNGKTATTLTCAVYEVEGDTWTYLPKASTIDTTINMSINVPIRLMRGKTYKIVFWADAKNSIYTFDYENKKVTANYNSVVSNNEELDAFFAVKEVTVSNDEVSESSESVTLKRPFAQLNIGTSGLIWAKVIYNVQKAGIKVKTYSTLNFVDETVSDEVDAEFSLAAFPNGQTFPVSSDDYDYLTMNYLFMKDKETKTVNLIFDKTNLNHSFKNVPLQRNYRTNIYGSLLLKTWNYNTQITSSFETVDNNEEQQ